MYKIHKSTLLFTGLVLLASVVACNLPSGAPAQKETDTPAPIASPTKTETPAATSTQPEPTASATPKFAPLCAATPANITPPTQCQTPIAVESSTFCAKKRPYNLLRINKNSVYEVQPEGFKCTDEGIKDGKRILTCTGLMATGFKVTVCDPTCAIPTVQADVTQCPQGYYYNNLLGCCTQGLQQLNPNCVTLNLATISCVVDCSVYVKQSTCEKNSQSCLWNKGEGACETRK